RRSHRPDRRPTLLRRAGSVFRRAAAGVVSVSPLVRLSEVRADPAESVRPVEAEARGEEAVPPGAVEQDADVPRTRRSVGVGDRGPAADPTGTESAVRRGPE